MSPTHRYFYGSDGGYTYFSIIFAGSLIVAAKETKPYYFGWITESFSIRSWLIEFGLFFVTRSYWGLVLCADIIKQTPH